RRRRGAAADQSARRALLARRPHARIRSALEGRVRHSQLATTAPRVRDDADQVDPPPAARSIDGLADRSCRNFELRTQNFELAEGAEPQGSATKPGEAGFCAAG